MVYVKDSFENALKIFEKSVERDGTVKLVKQKKRLGYMSRSQRRRIKNRRAVIRGRKAEQSQERFRIKN